VALDRKATLKKAEKLLQQGKLAGAIEEYARLVADQPNDWNSINALGDLYVRAGDVDRAVEQFVLMGDHLYAEGFLPKAAAVYKKVLKVKLDHEHVLRRLLDITQQQGLMIDSPPMLLSLVRLELAAGNPGDAQTHAQQLLRVAADARVTIQGLADELVASGQVDDAFACLEVIVDAALAQGEAADATALLQDFGRQHPMLRPFEKLIEIAVDLGDDGLRKEAQAQLADIHLAAGHGEEARIIAEDLVAEDASSSAHADRLRRARELLALRAPGVTAATSPDPLVDSIRVESVAFDQPEAVVVPHGSLETAASLPVADEGDDEDRPGGDEAIVIDSHDTDLSAALSALREQALVLPPMPAVGRGGRARGKNLEAIFDELRSRLTSEQQAEATELYERGMRHLGEGKLVDAFVDLQHAARMPTMRFKAASSLGHELAERGEYKDAVEWMERAAEAPPTSPEDGWTLMYELADTLERLGETGRAMAIFLELKADATEFRDVAERVERLRVTQQGRSLA
jgi:tetratricopeptide (TPR) repeat protein